MPYPVAVVRYLLIANLIQTGDGEPSLDRQPRQPNRIGQILGDGAAEYIQIKPAEPQRPLIGIWDVSGIDHAEIRLFR